MGELLHALTRLRMRSLVRACNSSFVRIDVFFFFFFFMKRLKNISGRVLLTQVVNVNEACHSHRRNNKPGASKIYLISSLACVYSLPGQEICSMSAQ